MDYTSWIAGFTMQHQAQTNWCWAAVASSVATFRNAGTTWTQCKIVNAELGRADCCTNGSSATCNKPWYLDKALTRVGHFVNGTAGVKTKEQIRNFILNDNALVVAVQWTGGGGHALAITGDRQAGTTYYVTAADPWYGKSDVVYDTFKTQYQGSGTWIESHETKA